MTTKKFSKGEAIRFGWTTVKSNIGFDIALLITVPLIGLISKTIGDSLVKEFVMMGNVVTIASWVLSMVIQMGLVKIALRLCDNEDATFADLFSCFPLFFKYLFSSILYGLIVFIGAILLIIPGIIWSIKFGFFIYFVVDKEAGPIEALKRSSAITKGVKWNLFVFGLLLAGINLLGSIVFLVGLFVTVPMSMFATVFVYRKLLSQTEIEQTV